MFWPSAKPKSRNGTRACSLALQQLDFNRLPILTAAQITDLLHLETRLKSIEKLTGAGQAYYQLLYEPALRQYLESVQLAPASAAHHHAGPGGLAVHTLDVIDLALRKRKSYNLPQRSNAEAIAEQEHIWTYAIFAGAILHDIGKMVCSTKLVLESGSVWTPHDASILATGATHYRVVFDKAGYKLHTLLSNGFLHLLPPKGRGWLAQYPEILAQLTAWLAGDYYAWGVIGEIVRQADRESVAKNLGLGGDRERFPNAPAIPLVDKLTTALRQLLDEGQLKLNRANGSAGWCDGPFTYLVCGTVADAVRRHLLSAGATDVPVDNTRIFDTWQEHGFVVATPGEGGAVWHLTVNGKLTLTVLKFETARLFHPSRRPEPFAGNLVLKTKASIPVGTSNTSEPLPAPVGSSNTPERETKTRCSASDPIPPTALLEVPTPQAGIPDVGCAAQTESQQRPPQGVERDQTDDHVKPLYKDEKTPPPNRSTDNPKPPLLADVQFNGAKSLTLENPHIAEQFLAWLKDGIRAHRITVNRPDALVHVVKEGVLIVSPLSFKLFVRELGLISDTQGEEMAQAQTKAATKVQKQLERMMVKQKLHRKTRQGMNIHTYLVQGEHREAKIRGWLLPLACIYISDPHPEPNPALCNLSGFFEETAKKSSRKSGFFLNLSDH
jgi:integrating conjugative element relaxase (TIGR03760 family)